MRKDYEPTVDVGWFVLFRLQKQCSLRKEVMEWRWRE